jgi:hypothetical protein
MKKRAMFEGDAIFRLFDAGMRYFIDATDD